MAMDQADLDKALVAAAFALAAEKGWRAVSVAEAARRADLPLDQARARFPSRAALLLRFGSLADQVAVAVAPAEGPHRDRLFDTLMRRIDFLQTHRRGVLALLRGLRFEPAAAALLTAATLRSMAWMLESAGISTHGLRGRLRTKGLLAVWLSTIRAWQHDETEDLSATMAALDRALTRAERAEECMARAWCVPRREHPPGETAHEAPPPSDLGEPTPDAGPIPA
jgi:AcrR family transcriptional regulator